MNFYTGTVAILAALAVGYNLGYLVRYLDTSALPPRIDDEAVYLLTGVHAGGDLDARCFGFSHDLTVARVWVRHNKGDLHECRYTHLVIEKLTTGLYPTAEEVQWYVWKLGRWEACLKPAKLTGVTNFSLG